MDFLDLGKSERQYFEGAINKPILSKPIHESIIMPRDYSLADWKYEKIKEQIEDFQSGLSDDVDVCVALASFGTNMIMQVTDIGYQNPDMLYFYGSINGNETQLIQHTSQLNFVLMAIKKEEPTRPPRRIGFLSDE